MTRKPRCYQTGIRVQTEACTPLPVPSNRTANTITDRRTVCGAKAAAAKPAASEQARLSRRLASSGPDGADPGRSPKPEDRPGRVANDCRKNGS